MFSTSQEQKPQPFVKDKKANGESRPSLTPKQVRAGSTVIMTHAERQAFWKKFLAGFEDTSHWPSNTSVQENFPEAQDLSLGVEFAKVKDLLERAKNANVPPSQAFVGSDLSGADLRGINFLGFNLSGANLSRADLSGAKLRFAELRDADLSHANLRDANLSSTNLSGANLSGADLSGANLKNANLRDADLSDANLSGAELSDTDLERANRKEVQESKEREPLTGDALLKKVKELEHLSKEEKAKATGYYTVTKSGVERVNMMKFLNALIDAEGIELDGGKQEGSSRGGRSVSYRISVQSNGNLIIGSAYTKQIGWKPGDEFEISLGRKHIHLRQLEREEMEASKGELAFQ